MKLSRHIFGLILVISASLFLDARPVSGQASANRPVEEPVQMIVDYGEGKQKRRESHHGEIEPVSLRVGQSIGITLQFLRKRAGEKVAVAPMDGGQVQPAEPATLDEAGTLSFTFTAGPTPGLYRLMINGSQQYLVSIYAVDPKRSALGRQN